MSEAISPVIGLPLIAVLLLLNGMFVAAEFAFVTVRRTRMQHLAEEGSTSARTVLTALGNLDYWVAASQLGITMASIALGFFGEPVLASLIEPPVEQLVGAFAPAIAHGLAIAIAFGFVTALHIVIGEFVPKTMALERPDETSLWVSRPMQIFVRIFGPLVGLLNWSGNTLLRLLGMDLRPLRDEPLAAEDLAYTLESSASAGLISRRELDLARHALQLSIMQAHELMVPRNEIVAIPFDATIDDVFSTFEEHRHTRYPVYDDTIDNIGGILNAKRLLLAQYEGETDWRQYVEPVVVVPESISAEEALNEARQIDAAMLILADEYGGTAGLISVFDVVEYLAGELLDEYGTGFQRLRYEADGTLVLSGLARLSELEEALNLTIPDVDAVTVGGMVTALLGRIPSEGDQVAVNGFTARVDEMDQHRVARVVLMPHQRTPAKDQMEQGVHHGQ